MRPNPYGELSVSYDYDLGVRSYDSNGLTDKYLSSGLRFTLSQPFSFGSLPADLRVTTKRDSLDWRVHGDTYADGSGIFDFDSLAIRVKLSRALSIGLAYSAIEYTVSGQTNLIGSAIPSLDKDPSVCVCSYTRSLMFSTTYEATPRYRLNFGAGTSVHDGSLQAISTESNSSLDVPINASGIDATSSIVCTAYPYEWEIFGNVSYSDGSAPVRISARDIGTGKAHYRSHAEGARLRLGTYSLSTGIVHNHTKIEGLANAYDLGLSDLTGTTASYDGDFSFDRFEIGLEKDCRLSHNLSMLVSYRQYWLALNSGADYKLSLFGVGSGDSISTDYTALIGIVKLGLTMPIGSTDINLTIRQIIPYRSTSNSSTSLPVGTGGASGGRTEGGYNINLGATTRF